MIEILLKYKADCILDEDEDGNTPLHLASLSGYHRSVQTLLNFQADFDARYYKMLLGIYKLLFYMVCLGILHYGHHLIVLLLKDKNKWLNC